MEYRAQVATVVKDMPEPADARAMLGFFTANRAAFRHGNYRKPYAWLPGL
jgi:hypothetical protein